jgi:hypothetical protein
MVFGWGGTPFFENKTDDRPVSARIRSRGCLGAISPQRDPFPSRTLKWGIKRTRSQPCAHADRARRAAIKEGIRRVRVHARAVRATVGQLSSRLPSSPGRSATGASSLLERRRLCKGSRAAGSARYWYYEVEQHDDGPGATAQEQRLFAFAPGPPAPRGDLGVGVSGQVPVACAVGRQGTHDLDRPAMLPERSGQDRRVSELGRSMRETCCRSTMVHDSPSAAGVAEHHAAPVARGTRRTRRIELHVTQASSSTAGRSSFVALREAQSTWFRIGARDCPAAASPHIAGFPRPASALLACRVRERRQRRLSNCTAGRAQLPPLPGRARERVACATRGGCCSRGSSAGERHTGRALWRSAVLCHGLGAVFSFENRRRFGSGYCGTPRIYFVDSPNSNP